MDISHTIEADSTQINADDLTNEPRIVTVAGVSKGAVDQPVNIELVEFPGRAFRPCKSMRRVLVHAWGPNAAEYVGRRMAIFNDPTVKWGGQDVGGVRIKALSHIDKRLTLALTATRGKKVRVIVEPLADAPEVAAVDVNRLLAAVEKADTKDSLRELWQQAATLPEGSQGRKAASDLITARLADLEAEATA